MGCDNDIELVWSNGSGLLDKTSTTPKINYLDYCQDTNLHYGLSKNMHFVKVQGNKVEIFVPRTPYSFPSTLSFTVHRHSTQYYEIDDTERTWAEADSNCKSKGMILATITSKKEYELFKARGGWADKKYWIGISKTAAGWNWIGVNFVSVGLYD